MEESGPTKDFHKFATFKEKIRTEGKPLYGRIAVWYSKQFGDEQSRIIDPIAYFSNWNGKYLLAYCHLRGAERTFIASPQLWDVRDLLTGKRFKGIDEWIEQAPAGGAPMQPPSAEVQQTYAGPPEYEDAVMANQLISEFCEELSEEGLWHTSLHRDDDVRFTLTVKRRKNGIPIKNAHFSVSYWGRDRTWSHAVLPNGEFGPSELSSDRHNPLPWEPYCKLNRRIPLERFTEVKALFDQLRGKSRSRTD